MLAATRCLLLLSALALGALAQEPTTSEQRYPASTALAEGVSPEALAALSQLVQSLVDEQEIVGAELLVIKNGNSVLHEAYGLRDQESKLPMETDSVFCVRSMTKPVVGAAILMLVQDKQLKLSDKVSKHLPSFAAEETKGITVEHLLTHTSGLPMSLLLGKDLHKLSGIQEVAELGAGTELEFAPGSDFHYSDQGTDTLTALIEVVSGMTAAEFVRTRVLSPLGMTESACVMTEDSPLRGRALAKYGGSRGAWLLFWSPSDPPLFPFFLGSQGLYSTLKDYARFMEFWQKKGRVDGERLLRSRYVKKALTPGTYPLGSATGFPELRADYGYLMQIWSGPDGEDKDDKREVVAFGHTGSDGTHAWVFPEHDAMVLYFTQSRGSATSLRIEEALGTLLLGAPFDPNEAAPPFEQYLGYYREDVENDLYRAIIRDGEDLALEILGKGVVPLTYAGEDRWKFRQNPSIVLAFDRSQEGTVTGYHIGDHQEFRFEPAADLPDVSEVAERVAKIHGMAQLEKLGSLRTHGEIDIPKVGIKGEITTILAWPNRFREETTVGDEYEHSAYDGEKLWYASRLKPLAEIEGERAELLLSSSPLACLGDWRETYPEMRLIQRIGRDGQSFLIARSGDTTAPATTIYVDEETGRVKRIECMTHIDTMGRIGQRISFDDYRDISGVLLPFEMSTQIANPMIGSVNVTVTGYEIGVEVPEGTFQLLDLTEDVVESGH